MNAKVQKYMTSAKKWQEEMLALREILLTLPLEEDIKWGKPCYSFEGSNVVIIQDFKSYLALLFFKGVLLKDPKKLLQKTGENTQVGRQLRFTGVTDIGKQKSVITSYVKEAIKLEKAGAKIEVKKTELKYPSELQAEFKKHPALKKAFEALTPGRQRAYNIFFSSAKQSETRVTRIDKYKKQILQGKGMND